MIKNFNFTSTDRRIHELLLDIGMSPRLLGYRYIVSAVKMIQEDPDYLDNITKWLYVDVAKNCSSTPSRVERNMRNAIACAFGQGDYDTINYVFKNSVNPLKGVPSNSQFLATLYYYMELHPKAS
ncbi:MAG: sporulation initiation factor Spo0A C-terminal domain-containing protein [Lachnospiraceae bacterium]|nr:sporulation initiation factor Spo0A C-terminal domain-containing protein [Lachnospiraceae bacterium]